MTNESLESTTWLSTTRFLEISLIFIEWFAAGKGSRPFEPKLLLVTSASLLVANSY